MVSGSMSDFLSLTKPRVVILLQITAICSVIIHDVTGSGLNFASVRTMVLVLIGGYLSAGGANAINMWYDRDIDPHMTRTSKRPIPQGKISPKSALIFGVLISILGVSWFYIMTNSVAAFWSAFSIFFYVMIYSMWLKRTTPQNIVIGGIAGSTPPVIGWAACDDSESLSFESANSFFVSIFDLGSLMPWFMFILIFLWTPPHFWALALYRSEEYAKVGVPMMPGIKGKERTIVEMKIYCVLLILLSMLAPLSLEGVDSGDWIYYLLGITVVFLSVWYSSTIWRIDVSEKPDETGRMASAANSFFLSMLYLALMFVVLVSASFGFSGAALGAGISIVAVGKIEWSSGS